jgi:hypothetical protein
MGTLEVGRAGWVGCDVPVFFFSDTAVAVAVAVAATGIP